MDENALKLCSAFARQPNHLGYCGRPSAQTAFHHCLTGQGCTDVAAEIKQFIVLNPYLKTISEITGLPPFSYGVVEALWLGNDLLNRCQPSHYRLLLKHLKSQGVPRVLLDEAKAKPPKSFIPIHLFNILHIGVGKASGSVPFNLKSINQCMVRWGIIHRLLPNHHAKVTLNSLNPKLKLIRLTAKVTYQPKYFPALKVGDRIAVHWGEIAAVLSPRQSANLKYWTRQFLANFK